VIPKKVLLAVRARRCEGYLTGKVIFKQGSRVRRSEELAMKLIQEHSDIPLPKIHFSFFEINGGTIAMEFSPGKPLDHVWPGLNDETKEGACREIWHYICEWRKIPRPANSGNLCLSDGWLY
jgi:hypothetical protein